MNLNEQDKVIINKFATDGNFNAVRPIFHKIFYNSFGAAISAERLLGRKDIIELFEEVIKEKKDDRK